MGTPNHARRRRRRTEELALTPDPDPVSSRDEQVRRDLRWVLASASLVDGSDAVPGSDSAALELGELTPAQLERLGETCGHQHRVGRYFEELVAFWLQEIRGVEVVAFGEQVRDGKRTIGELDCLFRDQDGVFTHWELAVKFFLHHPTSGDASDFPGPNATDNFERKAARLFEHQLPLSKLARPEVVRRQAFVRGCIMAHEGSAADYDLPVRLSREHERGWWLRAVEIAESPLLNADDHTAAVMAKPHWLAHPVTHEPLGSVRDQLSAHFAGPAHPVMMSVREPGGECHRVVVVNDDWPNG